MGNNTPKPSWLKVRLPGGEVYQQLKSMARDQALSTVCEEARCPNIQECWSGGTATFMVMGDTCTRGCRFCSVKTGNPQGWLDLEEPAKLSGVIEKMKWDYVVLTSVDRDDLPDGGASHFARCVQYIHAKTPEVVIEVLIPDFQGRRESLEAVVNSAPSLRVVAQNIETVERLTYVVRDRRAGYQQTLKLLKTVKGLRSELYTKSSVMLGLGETEKEVRQCLQDLREHEVDIVTLGQYLQPSQKQLPVERFVPPETFQYWKHVAENEFGFLYCASAPLARSSYRAGELFMKNVLLQSAS